MSLIATLTPAQLSTYPLHAPPDGVQSNFSTTAENNNKPMIGVTSFVLAIMLIFYSNRVYTKACIVRRFSWDDLTITIAFIGSIVLYASCIWGALRGRIGYHNWDVNIAQSTRMDFIIPVYLGICMPSPIYLFLKDTFFIMYLYIFGPLRWLRLCAYVGIAITTAFYTGMTVASFVIATPRPGETWSEHLHSKEIEKSIDLPIPTSSFGVVVDLVILVLPIIAVMQLQLPTRRKIGVILVFMTGSLACIFSILNIPFRNIENKSLNKDSNWDNTTVNIVTLLEMFIGVICACAPSAAKSYNHHFQQFGAFKIFILSHLSKTRGSTTKQSKASLISRKAGSQPEYPSDIDVYQGPGHADHAPNKSIRTFIHSGSPHDLENDGIHLTFEMQNHSTQADHLEHEALSSMEPVVTKF